MVNENGWDDASSLVSTVKQALPFTMNHWPTFFTIDRTQSPVVAASCSDSSATG